MRSPGSRRSTAHRWYSGPRFGRTPRPCPITVSVGGRHDGSADPLEAGMTELLAPPRPVRVRLDAQGVPTHLESAAGWQSVTRVLNRWPIDCDWWRSPISREYWRLLIDEDLALECYCDRALAQWLVERVYD